MNFYHDWGIPLVGLLVWMALILAVIPATMNYLSRRAEQRGLTFNAILLSALGTPLILFFFGLGLSVFIDIIPSIPEKWEKYFNASHFILFVAAGFLFLDRLMMRVIRQYSKTVDVIASSAGVMKTLYRSAVLTFAVLIVLDHLKITITPFLASLGIGGLVVALALQETLSNFFSGIYLFLDKPIRIGDYVKLESGEEGYVRHMGWHSTRIQMLSNSMVIVSNAKLASSRITNFYLPDQEVAVLVNVAVAYQSDLEKVEKATVEVAQDVLHETEGGMGEFKPFIRYNNFGDSGINFTVILRAKEFTHQYLIIHEFIKRLHRRYGNEGIEISLPVRNIYIRNAAPETVTLEDHEKT